MSNPRCNDTTAMIEYWETERDGSRTQYHNHEVVHQRDDVDMTLLRLEMNVMVYDYL